MTQTLSIIGVGAFGEFILRHVTPYFDTYISDDYRDLSEIENTYNVKSCSLEQASECQFIIIAVPVREIQNVASKIKNRINCGQLVMDVASVKCLPAKVLSDTLSDDIDIVGLHPLFGPQSGKNGISGQNIVVVNVRGDRSTEVSQFASKRLGLNVISCTAEEHDEQMAYVQGLTHMVAKVFQMMDMPAIYQETKTFSLLCQMVDIVKNDSDALFQAIQNDNPYVEDTKRKFFNSVKELEAKLGHKIS